MITINLLPDELQQEYRKPKSQIISIAVSVFLAVISVGFFVGIQFFVLPQRQKELKELEAQAMRDKVYEADHTEIKRITDEFKKYGEAVAKCKEKRVRFAPRLAKLAAIVTKEGHNDIYWLEDLSIKAAKAAGKEAVPSMPRYEWEGKYGCKTMELQRARALVERINKEFFEEVEAIDVPVPKRSQITGDYVEKKCYMCTLKMITKMGSKAAAATPQRPPKQG